VAEQPGAAPYVVGKERDQLIVPQKLGMEHPPISAGVGNPAHGPRESRKD